MAEDLINSIVDRGAVSKQLTDTTAEVRELQQAVLDTAKEILGLNNSIGKAANNKDFTTATNEATTALDKMTKQTEQQRLGEIRLQQQREKAFDDYERKLQKQIADAEKAQQRADANTAKELANSQKRQAAIDRETQKQEAATAKQNAAIQKSIQPINVLKLTIDEATLAAQNIGVTFGKSSPEFLKASDRVSELRKQLDGINQPLGNFKDNVGNYGSVFQKAFSGIRTLANIIPNFGIGTFFLLLGTGLVKLAEATGLYSEKISLLSQKLKEQSQIQDALNQVRVNAATSSRDEIQALNSLYKASQNRALGITEQTQAAIILQNTYPTTFGNFTTEQILAGKSADAYKELRKEILDVAYAKAISDKIGQNSNRLLQDDLNITKEQTEQARLLKIYNENANKFNANQQNLNRYNSENQIFQGKALEAKRDIEASQKRENALITDRNILNKENLSLENRQDQIVAKRGVKALNGGKNQSSDEFKNQLELSKQSIQRDLDTQNSISENRSKALKEREVALKKSLDDQKKLIDIDTKEQLMQVGISESSKKLIIEKANTEKAKAQDDYYKKLGNLEEQNNKKPRDDRKQSLDEQLKSIRQHQDDILSDETKSYDQRFQATKDFQYKSDELIEKAEKAGIINHQKAENMIGDIDETAAKNRKKIQDDAVKELEKIFNDQLKNAQEHDKRVISDLNKTTQQRIEIVSKAANEEQLKLAAQLQKGEISRDEYEQKSLEISTKASAETLKIQLEQLETLIKARKDAGQDTADDEAKEAAIRLKIDTDLTNEKIKNAKKEAELRDRLRRELKQKEQEIADALINLAQSIVDASFKNQQDKLAAQSDAIDKQADADKASIERSLLTDKQKADKEKVIDAQAQLQKEQIAQASKKLAHDQAVADRAFAIASIVEHTAIAAIAALAPPPLGLGPVFGLPLAASIGALGAIQIATVLATPLPSYADGIDYHPGGFARFGEAGPELIIEPNKMPYLVGSETIGELPRGTEVISNSELMNAMARPGSNTYIENQLNVSAILQELQLTRSQLSKAFGSQTIQSTHITKDGFKRGVTDSEDWNRYLKRNIN